MVGTMEAASVATMPQEAEKKDTTLEELALHAKLSDDGGSTTTARLENHLAHLQTLLEQAEVEVDGAPSNPIGPVDSELEDILDQQPPTPENILHATTPENILDVLGLSEEPVTRRGPTKKKQRRGPSGKKKRKDAVPLPKTRFWVTEKEPVKEEISTMAPSDEQKVAPGAEQKVLVEGDDAPRDVPADNKSEETSPKNLMKTQETLLPEQVKAKVDLISNLEQGVAAAEKLAALAQTLVEEVATSKVEPEPVPEPTLVEEVATTKVEPEPVPEPEPEPDDSEPEPELEPKPSPEPEEVAKPPEEEPFEDSKQPEVEGSDEACPTAVVTEKESAGPSATTSLPEDSKSQTSDKMESEQPCFDKAMADTEDSRSEISSVLEDAPIHLEGAIVLRHESKGDEYVNESDKSSDATDTTDKESVTEEFQSFSDPAMRRHGVPLVDEGEDDEDEDDDDDDDDDDDSLAVLVIPEPGSQDDTTKKDSDSVEVVLPDGPTDEDSKEETKESENAVEVVLPDSDGPSQGKEISKESDKTSAEDCDKVGEKEVSCSRKATEIGTLPEPFEDRDIVSSASDTILFQSGKLLTDLKHEVKKLRGDYIRVEGNNKRLSQANASAGASFETLNQHAQQLQKKFEDSQGALAESQSVVAELRDELAMKQTAYVAEVQSRLRYQKALQEVADLVQNNCKDSALAEQVLRLADKIDEEALEVPVLKTTEEALAVPAMKTTEESNSVAESTSPTEETPTIDNKTKPAKENGGYMSYIKACVWTT